MSQFGRPPADTTIGGYTTQAGGATNLYQTIDEVIASDTDYIRSALAPSSAAYVTKLSSVEDPISSTGHVVRYRYAKDSAGGSQINLTVQLRQDYVSEGALGTQIATWSHTNISEAFTTVAQTLSGTEADTITDYANLYLRVVATQV